MARALATVVSCKFSKGLVAITSFFAHHIDELPRYQYFNTEYDPKLEIYKLLTAKTHLDEKPQDIVLIFQ